MANQSLAIGTIKLDGNWTDEMKNLANEYLKEAETKTYSIESDGFNKDSNTTEFRGFGRWSFNNNLEDFEKFYDFSGLHKLMYENDAKIIFTYTELEEECDYPEDEEELDEYVAIISSNGSNFELY